MNTDFLNNNKTKALVFDTNFTNRLEFNSISEIRVDS